MTHKFCDYENRTFYNVDISPFSNNSYVSQQ